MKLMEKNELRKQYFRQFSEYRRDEKYHLAERQIKHNVHLFFHQKMGSKKFNIMAYQPLKSEIPVLDLLNEINCEMHIPEILGENLAPLSLKTGERKEIMDMDFIIVPGLYINENGFRLGRGRGYYDRLLSGYAASNTGFVGYDWQVLDSIPLDSWDKPVGYWITESRIHVCHE